MSKKQCRDCKLWFNRPEDLTRHTNGKYCWGIPIVDEETQALYKYWKKKTMSMPSRKLEFHLTPTELMQLLTEAGITVKDIGQRHHQYCLARHGDSGNYEMGNCRFITMKENTAENQSRRDNQWKRCHTPKGIYPSVAEAAKAYGISRQAMDRRVNRPADRPAESFPDFYKV